MQNSSVDQLKKCSPSWNSVSFVVKRWSPDGEGGSSQGWVRLCLQCEQKCFRPRFPGSPASCWSFGLLLTLSRWRECSPPFSSFISFPLSFLFSLFTQFTAIFLLLYSTLGQHSTSHRNTSASESLYQDFCQRCSDEKQVCRTSNGRQTGLRTNSWFCCLVAL